MKRTTLSVSLTLGLGIVVFGGAPIMAQSGKANDVVSGEIVVGIRADRDVPSALAGVSSLTNTIGTAVGHNSRLHAYRIRLQPGVTIANAIAYYQKRSDVVFAEPNRIYHMNATPNDTNWSSQYGPAKINATAAWGIWQPQSQIILAILDTGIDYTHPDLTNKILRDASNNVIGANTVGSNVHSGNASDPADDQGHGTHCAGIAAAQINNNLGVAGIAGWDGVAGHSDTSFIKLMPVKVLDYTGSGTDVTVGDGITWATDHGARVISMSLSGGSTTYLSNAVNYAYNHGVVVVAAAGNSHSSTKEYPGGYSNVLSVASTDNTDTLSTFSNYGTWVTCAAPGTNIYATLPTYSTPNSFGTNYGTLSGTSMATPHVAGEAAFILAQFPSLTNAQLYSHITATANVDSYTPYLGRTIKAGAGRVNVYKSLVAAGGTGANIPPTVSITAPSNGASFTAPANITIDATAGDSDGTVSKVEFYNGTTLLGTDTTSPYSFAWNNVPAGSYALTAVATDNQGAATTSAGVNITVSNPGSAVAVSTLTFAPTTVIGGTNSTGTVTLAAAAPAGGQVVTLSSGNTSAVTVPASVTVPAGATSKTFTANTSPVAAQVNVTISATSASVTKTGTLQVRVPYLNTFTLAPTTVPAGNTATGTLNLVATAGPGGVVVTLSSANPAVASVPASVTVPAGATSTTFPITTSAVASPTSVVITAKSSSTKTATLTVNPSGSTNQAPTVSITSPANNASFTAPASVTIDASASDDGSVAKVEFYAGTTLLGTDTTAPYSFVWNNVPAGSYVLTAVATDNLGASTTSTAVNITVNPANVAPTVHITSPTDGASFTAPANITIDASAGDSDGTVSKVEFYANGNLIGTDTTASYSFVWTNVPAGSYALTAVATDNQGATTTSTVVNITVSNPSATVPVSSVTLNPTAVTGSQSSTGTVTLASAAPAGGQVVTLSSSNTSVATVLASITVPAGTTSANFTVSTSPVAAQVNVTISAASGGGTKTATLQVRVPYLYNFTLSPATVVGGSNATGTVLLAAPAGPGGVVVTLSSANPSVASVPTSVTVPAGATTATFPITTSAVASSTPVVISAKQSSTRTATLNVTP